MMRTGIFEGMPFDENARLRLTELFPCGKVSVTRGRHYSLEEKFLYLVRSGADAVVMPRMSYGREITEALTDLYGKENRFVGETESAKACGDHS